MDIKEEVLLHFFIYTERKRSKMPEGYRTIISEGRSEYIDRKSRFLGLAVPVQNEEEAMRCLEQVRKKHYDARHNCWACVLGEDALNERASDDGEPSGTAGRPILEVIRHAGLTFVFVVVTRYFGGILLGTGALARAYTQAAANALEAAGKASFVQADRIEVINDYSDVGKLQYLFSNSDLKLEHSDFGERVRQILLCEQTKTPKIIARITELTSGRAKIRTEDAGFRLL